MKSNSSYSEREDLVSKIDGLRTKKAETTDRIMELELELKQLKKENDSFKKDIDVATNKLEALDASLSAEAKEVEMELSEVSQNIKLSECVSDVIESLQGFQSEVDKVTIKEMSSLQANLPETDMKSDLVPRMNSYIASMNDYFNSEYKLVSFLQQRAQKLRDGFPRMEMEIEECKGLGMTSNVIEMEKKLNQMQQNIVDDDNVIKALQDEANEMKKDLAKLVKEYRSTGVDGSSFEPMLKKMEITINAIV